jgi:hypothetical protein
MVIACRYDYDVVRCATFVCDHICHQIKGSFFSVLSLVLKSNHCHGASAVAASGRVILMRPWRCHVQGPRGELLSATGDSRARRTLERTLRNAPALLEQAHVLWQPNEIPASVCIENLSEAVYPLDLPVSPKMGRANHPPCRQAGNSIQMAQMRLHASLSSLRAPIWASP